MLQILVLILFLITLAAGSFLYVFFLNKKLKRAENVLKLQLKDLLSENNFLRQKLIDSDKQVKETQIDSIHVDKIRDDFVSIASHELRTPMTAIRSYAWMALHKSDVPLSEKVEKYLVRILISTERLINLVNDLLNVSRLEAEKIEVNTESVDLMAIVKDAVDEVYYSKSTSKDIQFTILEQPLPKVMADPERLREILLNLIGNSVKFTSSGGTITIGFFTDGKVVEVSIKDTGIGISQDDLGRLFQKFGKLDNSYVAISTSAGTGLGLYITRSLVELMNGKIWAQSAGLNKGTTFTFSLPVTTGAR